MDENRLFQLCLLYAVIGLIILSAGSEERCRVADLEDCSFPVKITVLAMNIERVWQKNNTDYYIDLIDESGHIRAKLSSKCAEYIKNSSKPVIVELDRDTKRKEYIMRKVDVIYCES